MDTPLRAATPLVLLVLALLAWFEPWLPSGLRATFGDVGVLRFVTGLLAVYTTMLVLERQRMETLFKQVLGELRGFQQSMQPGAAGSAAAAGPAASGREAEEAIKILIAALASPEADVRKTAAENLQRLTGQRFGEDRGAWQSWLANRQKDG